MKKYIVISCFVFIISLLVIPTIPAKEVIYDTYIGELGIEIISYSPNWQGEKLKEVYQELLKNTYGEEIKYLSTIYLYPDHPNGGLEEGLYHGAYQSRHLLNKTEYRMKKSRVIDLYNMNKKNNIEEIARTLAHEYGHHFTLYYLIEGENKTFDQWKDTDYARIRGVIDEKRIRSDYKNGHQWNITEIAAEDYIQLLGSPNAKISKYYDDITIRAKKKTIDEVVRWNSNIFNVYPQENFYIPLANDIEGLRDYWSGISKIDTEYNRLPSSSIIELTEVKDLGYGKKQFVISWTESFSKDSSDLLYTLVAFDRQLDQVIPIKTVKQGEELTAVMGSTKIVNKNEIIFYSDTFINSPKDLKVFIMDGNKNIISSNTLTIDFNNVEGIKLEESQEVYEDIKPEEFESSKLKQGVKKGWEEYFKEILLSLFEKII